MKIAYWNIQIDIREAIENRGHEAVAIDWHSDDWVNIFSKSECDFFIWYPHSLHNKFHRLLERSFFIENFLNKKCFPNAKSSYLFQDKIRQKNIFDLYKIPQAKTRIVRNMEDVNSFVKEIRFPFIAKDPYSYGGFNIELIRNSKDLDLFLKNKKNILKNSEEVEKKDYLYLQEFLDVEEEYRIITIGQKILLSYRKKSDEFLKHVWRGAQIFFDVDKSIENLVKKWNDKIGMDCCGWDLVKDKKGEIYLLEINTIFGTKVLESRGINLAEHILEYCLDKK